VFVWLALNRLRKSELSNRWFYRNEVYDKLAREADTLTDVYNDEMVTSNVPYALADRDFREKYGEIDIPKIMANKELLNEIVGIQIIYKEEEKTNFWKRLPGKIIN